MGENAAALVKIFDTVDTGSDYTEALAKKPAHHDYSLADVYKNATPEIRRQLREHLTTDWQTKAILEADALDKTRRLAPGGDEDIGFGLKRKDVRELAPNLGFSAVSAGSGLGVGVPAAVINPLAGFVAGGAASGVAAYRQDANMFMRQIRDAYKEGFSKEFGRAPTDNEWSQKKAEIMPVVQKHALFEAVPEAAGNMLQIGIILKPLTSVLGKNVMSRFVGKLAGLYGSELATETVTQIGQHNTEIEAGVSDGKPRSFTAPGDYWESMKEVAPQVFLLTTVLGGTVAAGAKVYDKTVVEPRDAAVTDMVRDALAEDRLDMIPDEQLNNIVSNVEQVAERRFKDKELAANLDILKKEQGRRLAIQTRNKFMAGTPEQQAEKRREQDHGDLRADLKDTLGDERPFEEIKAEREREAVAEASAIKTGIAEENDWPVPEQAAVVTLPNGDTKTGVVVDVYRDESQTPIIRVQTPDGEIYDIAKGEAEIRRAPEGTGEGDAPIKVQRPDDVDVAAQHVETPTPAQAEADNYKQGHVQIQPWLNVSIETPRGGTRTAKDGSWEVTNFPAHYGKIKGSTGADGDHVDIFIGRNAESRAVYVIDQIEPSTGKFDEHKVMYGFGTDAEARIAYEAAFSDGSGAARIGAIRPMSLAQFQAWLKNADKKKPTAYNEAAVLAARKSAKQDADAAANAERERVEAEEKARVEAGRARLEQEKRAEAFKKITEPFEVEAETGKITVTIRQVVSEESYQKQYGKPGGILNFELEGPGVNSETGFKAVSGVIYEGNMTVARAKQLGKKIAAENAKTKADIEREVKAKAKAEKERAKQAREAEKQKEPEKPESPPQQAEPEKPATDTDVSIPEKPIDETPKIGAQKKREREQTRRSFERVLHSDALDMGEVLEESGNDFDTFAKRADQVIYSHLVKQQREAAQAKDTARAKMIGEYLADGKTVLPPEFFKSLHKAAKQKAKQAELEKGRDPEVYNAALAKAMSEASIAEDGAETFRQGWDHAIKGKTKSTLPSGDVLAKGYEAAQKWLKTDDGRAYYQGKRGKKLENTGADLRRWFDGAKKKLDDATGVEAVIREIEEATSKAVFGKIAAADATPGATRFLEDIASELRTFKEWVTSEGPLDRLDGEWVKRRAVDAKLRGYLDGKMYLPDAGEKESTEQRIATVKEAADTYIGWLEQLTNALSGSKTVRDVAERFDKLMFVPDGDKDAKTEYAKKSADMWRRSYRMVNFRVKSWNTEHATKNENTATIEASRKQPLTPPRLDRVVREGMKDHRNGRDITPKQFKETFGFKDVGFGKWVGAKQDQDHLNYAYDAFMDLAETLGIKPMDISLGGTLYFTIGALGHGKHAAHFAYNQPHPDGGTVPVMNVTNTKGDGAISHEWHHALDFHLRKTASDQTVVRYLVADLKANYDYDKVRNSALRMLRAESWFTTMKKEGPVENARYAINYYANRGQSKYMEEARRLDGNNKEKPYWSNDEELFARASEAFVLDKLEGTNNYLVNPEWVGDGKVKPPRYRGTPYPESDERKRFSEWFEALYKSLDWTDAGPVLNHERYKENKPQHLEDYRKALDDLLAEIPELYEQIRNESRAKQLADEAEAAARKSRNESEAAELVKNQPSPEPVGELGKDEISSAFDQAIAELQESTQEQPKAPGPGEPTLQVSWTKDDYRFLLDKIENGAIVLLAEPEIGLPTIHDVTGAEHVGMGVFKVSNTGLEATFTAGGAMETTPSGRPYTTLNVSRGAFTYDRATILAKLREKLADKVTPNASDQTDKTAAKLTSEAAKLGVKGVDEAMKGLVQLFGGSRIKSFPAGFDEESYAKAKPHFEAALKAFQDAGKTLVDLFKFLIQNFGAGIRPYAERFAKDKNLTMKLGQGPSASREIAVWVRDQLRDGTDISWQDLFETADKAYGGTQADGKYTPKDAYDAMEAGVNLYIKDANIKPSSSVDLAERDIKNLRRLVDHLPTQTKRTSEQDEYQQFSTPPMHGYAAAWVANIRYGESMLEPSAGIGGLAIFADMAGARVTLNELSQRRAAVLREVLPNARMFNENAEQLDNVLPDDVKPTIIVMNPPFSSTAGRMSGARKTEVGAQHIEQALKRLADNGRLVAIVGEGMAMDKPGFKAWWDKIRAEYNVRANIGMPGKDYAKYGTTFDNQLLVIDKTGPTTGKIITDRVASIEELPKLLEGVRNDRPATDQAGEPDAAQPGREEPAAGGLAEPGRAAPSEPDAVGTGERAGDRAGGQDATDTGNGRGPFEPARSGQSEGGDAVPDRAGGRGRAGRRGTAGTGRATGSGESPAGDAARKYGGDSAVRLEQAEKQKAEGEITEAIFEDYKPQRLKVDGAKPHPGKLVQSAAMAAVEPPAPTYVPNLPKEVITEGKLSLAQIEAVVYAGQAHKQFLADGSRRGFFIGDGTGVGKGREIAGIILDNIRQGRERHVWISEKRGLFVDAGRDFSGVGGDKSIIFQQHKTTAADAIKARSGILFTTYSMLRGGEKKQATDKTKQGKTRVQQLVDWLGADFDGVIVFDESHNMANAVQIKGERGKQDPSKQALAGLELQKQLPKARVVYVSATGATEVSNLVYAQRLGLWGEGTAFSGSNDFVTNVSAGGVASMELVARDLKALGSYIARSLSFDGVTYDRLEHTLTGLQTDIYNELAKAWQIVLQNVNEALKETLQGKNGAAKSAAMSRFWSSHQRFFNQVVTSLQMPSIVEDAKKHIEAGHAVVMQLVNTNEAEQERQVARAEEEGKELEELDFTPRQALLDYVRAGYPVQQYEEYKDEENNTRTRPVVDSRGKPVINKKMVEKRDALLKTLEEIKVPENPIDIILESFGSETVAEVTGRSRRFIRKRGDDGEYKIVEEKRTGSAAQVDAAAFMEDKRRVLIFTDAGGTGYSYHADKTQQNQRRRFHYLVQPGWRADKAVQGFGRTNRTNQDSAPHYVLPTTNLKAQKRFISSIARRLDQLGALTKGQRQAGSQGLFSAADNLESKYATEAMQVFFEDLYGGRTPLDFAETTAAMGLDNLIDAKTGALNDTKIPAVPRFLNRLLSLTTDMQDKVFDEFHRRMEEIVHNAVTKGTYDQGVETLKALKVHKLRDDVAYTDSRSGAETHYVELELTLPTEFHEWADVQQRADLARSDFAGYFRNNKTGKVFALINRGTRTGADGKLLHRAVQIHVSGSPRYIDNANDITDPRRRASAPQIVVEDKRTPHYEELTQTEAQAAWEKERAESPQTHKSQVHMITGAILPIWDRVTGQPRVIRTQTDDGERILGRVVHKDELKQTLKNLGLGSSASKMSAEQLLSRIMAGDKALLANGWQIKKVRVSDDDRIEVTAPTFSAADQKLLQDQSAFVERIQWRERVFIPTGDSAASVLDRIIKAKPVVDIIESGATAAREDGPRYGTPVQTETTEFKRWFGDSKVVDADGKPLVVYHGNAFLRKDIKVFRTNSELGAHFGSLDQAEMFADGGAKPRIIKAYLRIKNPLRVLDAGAFDGSGITGQLRDLGVLDAKQYAAAVKLENSDALTPFLQKAIEAKGYDGVVYLNRREGPDFFGPDGYSGDDIYAMSDNELLAEFPDARDSYIAFRPEQIKSAIGNRGTFDARNPNILLEPKSGYNDDSNGKVYDDTATDEAKRLGRKALSSLERLVHRGRFATIRGSAIPADFADRGHISLVGQRVESADDLAVLAQVYRDPRFETFRYFFVRGNEIVGHTGVSARLPNSSPAFIGKNSAEIARFIEELRDQMEEVGADGYYLLHNHPSGEPNASGADIALTRNMESRLPGFRGHVIIDTDSYGLIEIGKTGSVSKGIVVKRMPPTYRLGENATVPHPLLGRKINGPDQLAAAVKEVELSPNHIVLIGVNVIGTRGIMEVPVSTFDRRMRITAIVRSFARMTGSQHVFAAHVPKEHAELVKRGIKYGVVRDVIFDDGTSAHSTFRINKEDGFELGKETVSQARIVEEEKPDYSDTEKMAENAEKALKGGDGDTAGPDIMGDDREYLGDINQFQRLAIHPRTIAAYEKSFVPVYESAIHQFERRDEHAAELMRESKPYFDLKAEEKQRVNAVLELGRHKRAVYGRGKDKIEVTNDVGDLVLSKQGETITLTDSEKSGYWSVRRAMNLALNRFKEQVIREWGLDPEKTKTSRDILGLITDNTPAKDKERYIAAAELVREIEQARRQGYVPLTRWGDVGIAVSQSFEETVAVSEADDTAQRMVEEHGDGKVEIKRSGDSATVRLVVTQRFEMVEVGTVNKVKMLAGLSSRKLGEIPEVKSRLDALSAEYGEGFDIRVFRVPPKGPMEAVDITALDALAEVAKIDEQTWDTVRQDLADAIKRKSFRRHFIGSRNVPGYSGDFERAIADYIVGISGYLARREFSDKWDRAIDRIPREKPKLRSYAQKYRDYVNSPHEELQLLRQFGFVYYIAGSFATAMTNVTQVPLITMPYLTQFVTVAQANIQLTRAYKDVTAMFSPSEGMDLFDPSKAPSDVRDALQHAWDEGFFVPLQVYEMMGMAFNRSPTLRGVSKKTRQAVDAVALMFTGAERVNRLVTFIASYRIAKMVGVEGKAMSVLKDNPLAQRQLKDFTPELFAEWVIDETHYRMGKVNRPEAMRKWGTAVFQFKTFLAQSLELFYRLAQQNGKAGLRAFGLLMALLFLSAGLWGLPFAENIGSLIEWLHKKFTGLDLDTKAEVRKAIYELTGSVRLAQAFSHGLPSLVGVETTKRLGFGDVVPTSTKELLGIPAAMLIDRPMNAYQYGKREQWLLSAAETMPNFIKNPMVAQAWRTEGVRSQATGKVVIPKEDVTTGQVVTKSLGATPAEIANRREAEYALKRLNRSATEFKAEKIGRIARLRADLYRAEQAGDESAKNKAHDALLVLAAEIAQHNLGSAPHERLILSNPSTQRTIKDRTREELGGPKTQDRKAPRQARGERQQLREAYGVK